MFYYPYQTDMDDPHHVHSKYPGKSEKREIHKFKTLKDSKAVIYISHECNTKSCLLIFFIGCFKIKIFPY
jgi:hypothetical protein